MIFGLILVLAVAVLDWIAVAQGWKKVEIIAKPATMAALFLIFALVGWFSSLPLIFFGAGLLLSLAGDVFLMFSDRWFIPGLAAFLLAHVAYIVGFNLPLPDVSSVWSVSIAIILALTAGRVLRRIVAALKGKGLQRLVGPVVLYGMVITIMLLSAMLTVFNPEWDSIPALLASLGAFLFYFSDIILAWNKFVAPIKNGRLVNMVSYHLGQIALVAGALIQFTK
ncbi:MAG: hypothetical protein FD146_391 [Anaerolineaceae bacterium]|nr:MAG: hypothetical protein FD146_391 [Anaerolineaceae bacterium]